MRFALYQMKGSINLLLWIIAFGNVVDILDNRYESTVRDYIHINTPHVEVMSLDFMESILKSRKGTQSSSYNCSR